MIFFYEQSYGLTPLTFTLCLAAFIAVITMNKKKKTVPVWVTAFLITFIIVNIMIIKISSHTSSLYPYTSLWYFAYQLLPGANAIRAMSRIYVLFMLPAALLLGWFIEKITNKVAPYYRGCLIAFAGSLVLLDNFNLTEPATLRYSDIKNFTDNVPAPPADCKVFFVIAADPVYGKTQALAGLQAWEIARKYNLYCINGYSGNFPTEIHPDKNHSQADIEKNIDSYIAKYKIENVYVYDVQKKIWSKFESAYLHCTVK